MLKSPFHLEDALTAEQFQKLGRLSLHWSSIDHILGNCLKMALRLSDEEAVCIVFPLGAEARFSKLNDLSAINEYPPGVNRALKELSPTMRALRHVRNTVAHSIVLTMDDGEAVLHNRSKGVNHKISEVLSTEELTNYAAHLVIGLRTAFGFKPGVSEPYVLPERPPIPPFLRSFFQDRPPQSEAKRKSRRQTSRGSH